MAKFTAWVQVDLEISPPAGETDQQREWVRAHVESGLSRLDTARRLEQQLEDDLAGEGAGQTVSVQVRAVMMVDDVDHPDDITGGPWVGGGPVA